MLKYFGSKIFLLVTLIIFMLGLFSIVNAEEVTIRWAVFSNDPNGMMQAAADRYSKENPDVNIQTVQMPSAADKNHDKQVSILAAQSSAIDIINIDVVWPPEFAYAGWLLPLDKYFSESEINVFPPAQIESNTVNGKLYAVPWMLDSHVLWYRQDLLDKYGYKAPDTWDELIEQAQTIKEGEGDIIPYSVTFGRGEQLICNFIEFLKGNGGSFFDEKGNVTINEAEAVEALQMMVDLIYEHGVVPEEMLNYDALPETVRYFNEGKALFHANWNYVWGTSQVEGSPVRGKVSYTPIPMFPGGTKADCVGGWSLGVSVYSKHKEEAIDFIKWYTSYEIQKWEMLNGGYTMTRTALADDPEILEAIPFLKDYKKIFENGVTRPRTPYYSAISDNAQSYISQALYKQLTPQEALDKLATVMEEIIAE
ncbi:ABC transporter substrate-binding protein [Halocella sp. SP3-1]|uniref:ABC transporter substrate-binding protein n=1 Tax=Halocella sp. SP3-1 TaxID=2382161 RepID=UPI000F760B75|nr:ABC transporter substrate-binding protein [Halocella sp. SP3-1]AZO96468.1 ABC transporter substrate-binding protein [Halocella sp. SP3-1]